jgi:hypothetical protein
MAPSTTLARIPPVPAAPSRSGTFVAPGSSTHPLPCDGLTTPEEAYGSADGRRVREDELERSGRRGYVGDGAAERVEGDARLDQSGRCGGAFDGIDHGRRTRTQSSGHARGSPRKRVRRRVLVARELFDQLESQLPEDPAPGLPSQTQFIARDLLFALRAFEGTLGPASPPRRPGRLSRPDRRRAAVPAFGIVGRLRQDDTIELFRIPIDTTWPADPDEPEDG